MGVKKKWNRNRQCERETVVTLTTNPKLEHATSAWVAAPEKVSLPFTEKLMGRVFTVALFIMAPIQIHHRYLSTE